MTAKGELVFRGTVGVDRDAPVGFRGTAVWFALDAKAQDERIAKLIEMTERYCVVLRTLAGRPRVARAMSFRGSAD